MSKAPSTPKKATASAPIKAPSAPSKKKLAAAADIAATEASELSSETVAPKKEAPLKRTVGVKRARVEPEAVGDEAAAAAAVKEEKPLSKRAQASHEFGPLRKSTIVKFVNTVWPCKKASNLTLAIRDTMVEFTTKVYGKAYTYSRDAKRSTIQLKDVQQAVKGIPFATML
jgi:histone H3/H4